MYGVFAFILFDSNKKKIFFGRDTYGVRPIFKSLSSSGTLGICSEAKGLLKLKQVTTSEASKIEALKPGSFEEYTLELRENSYRAAFVREHRFHVIGKPPKYDVSVRLTPDDVYANIRSCLTNAVRMRLMGQRRIG